MDLRVFNVSLV